MPAIDRTTAVRRAPMTPVRKTALIGGALYVLTFASSIPALLLLRSSVLNNPNYILGPGPDTVVILACLLDLVNALACIGTAVVLFPVIKRQNEAVSLGFIGSRGLEAAIIVTGVVNLLAVVTLRQAVAAASGADEAALVAVGQSLVEVRNWTFVLGPILMSGVNALLLGSLMYRSGLVPRIIPLLGLIGAPLTLISATALMFGLWTQGSVWHGIAVAPIFAWELSLGVWLVVKGFRPSPVLTSVAPTVAPAIVMDGVLPTDTDAAEAAGTAADNRVVEVR
jgi:hypothetical protein